MQNKVLLFFSLLFIFAFVNSSSVKIAAFNVQVFGKSKMEKSAFNKNIRNILKNFDMIFFQEIRDSSETAIYELLDLLNYRRKTTQRYEITVSPRLGSTSSKESYAYIYRKDKFELKEVHQYGDRGKNFERPPYSAYFYIKLYGLDYPIWLHGCHISPGEADHEIGKLYDVYKYYTTTTKLSSRKKKHIKERSILLGDFNADCSYLSATKLEENKLYKAFDWIIDEDSTVATSDCSYDRFVVTHDDLNSLVKKTSVYRFDEKLKLSSSTSKIISDHYPIVMELDLTSLVTCPINYLNEEDDGEIQYDEEDYDCYGINSLNTTYVCSGNGVCADTDDCLCDEGFENYDCSTEVFNCFSKSPNDDTVCSGNGYCGGQDDCICFEGYHGSECQNINTCNSLTAEDSNVCNSEGECLESGICNCENNFYGDFCEILPKCNGIDANLATVCSSHGTCTQNGCICDEEYTGTNCETKISCSGIEFDDTTVCSGNGICSKSGCSCDEGIEGSNCEIVDWTCFGISNAHDNVCSGHGDCLFSTSNISYCFCEVGHFGEDCSEILKCGGEEVDESNNSWTPLHTAFAILIPLMLIGTTILVVTIFSVVTVTIFLQRKKAQQKKEQETQIENIIEEEEEGETEMIELKTI